MVRYPCRMLNDLPPTSPGRIPLEPDEPWRIKPRSSHRRSPARNRKWMAAAIAGAIIATGAVTAFKLGGWSTAKARPTSAATHAQGPRALAPRPATPGPSSTPNRKAPQQHRFPRTSSPHRSAVVPAGKPPRTETASRHHWTPDQPRARRTHRTSSHAVHHSRRSTHSSRPRPKHQTPKWVGTECRRRFPHDSTRQAACNAALHNYFSR